jgi:type 1 fimbria pilin
MPDGDDRDKDTGIAVRVYKADGTIIVWNNNVAPDQHLTDPGTYGPFGLTIVNADATANDFIAGTSQLLITPNGHDRWITNVLIQLSWNDGNGRTCQSHNIIVDQDVNSATWSNSQTTLMQSVKCPTYPDQNVVDGWTHHRPGHKSKE